MTISKLVIMLVVVKMALVTSAAPSDSRDPQSPSDKSDAPTKGKDNPGVKVDRSQSSLQALIDLLENGQDIAQRVSIKGDLDSELEAVIANLVTAQSSPKPSIPAVAMKLRLDAERTSLDKLASDVARDLTVWDRLLTILERQAEEARRYISRDSVTSDSNGGLRRKLLEMKQTIDAPPNFKHDGKVLEKYLQPRPKEDAEKTNGQRMRNYLAVALDPAKMNQAVKQPRAPDFPREDNYVGGPNGVAEEGVFNSIKLRTLDLRIAILNDVKKRAVKIDKKVEKEAAMVQAEKKIVQLSAEPPNEDKDSRAKRLSDLSAARKHLLELFELEIKDAKEAAEEANSRKSRSKDGGK